MVQGLPGTQAEISKVALNGRFVKIPGYQAGAYAGDQQAIDILNSNYTATNLTGGQATLSTYYISPCDYLAVNAFVTITVVPTVAPATISIGIVGTLGQILNAKSLATTLATGFIDLTADAAFTGASGFGLGNQGDVIAFSTNGGATAGAGIWGCMIAPR